MSLSRWHKFFIRFFLGIVLLGIVFTQVNPEEMGRLFLDVDWSWVGVAVLIVLLLRMLMALRWKILLTSHGVQASLKELIWITFVSFFFGQFLPGGLGVDVIKGYHLISRKGQTANVTATLILDHFIGLLTMLAVAFLATFPSWFAGEPIPFSISIGLALIGVIVGWVFGFWIMRKVDPTEWVKSNRPWVMRGWRGIIKILMAITNLKQVRLVFVKLMVLATVVILFRCTLFYAVYKAFGAHVTLLDCIHLIPLVYVVMLLPLTSGGLGVREGALAFFFLPLGIAEEVSVGVGLLYHLIQIFSSLFGLLFWVQGRKHSKLDPPL